MGRNKFEKQLKDQLQQREIAPSKSAWDRVSEQLENSGVHKTRNFQWYSIAAGFIGIAFISVLYFTATEFPNASETPITDVRSDSTPMDSIPKIIKEPNPLEETFIVDSKVQEKTSIHKNQVQEQTSIQSITKRKTNKTQKDALVRTENEKGKIEKLSVPLNASDTLINAKIAEIVAQVAILEHDNSAVTEAEIDSLLRSAQRQILEDKIFRNDRSIDAMALLADVEDELDQSFRDQIFDALKDGFLKVRTAVADRNR